MLDYSVLLTRPRGLRLICDQCGQRFSRFNNIKRALERAYHFHDSTCARLAKLPGGIINSKTKETNNKRYGVEYALQSEKIIAKGRLTCLKRYGVEHFMMSSSEKERRKLYFLSRYGKTSYLATTECRAALRKASVSKYGKEFPMQSNELKASIDWARAAQKRHNTMKANGSYHSPSAPERKAHVMLCWAFGKDDVEHNKFIHKWPIDFYVKSIDAYIQVDGVYWHGLDRPLDEIRMSGTPRDRMIIRKMSIDLEQNMWFDENNMLLVRVTDADVNNDPEIVLERLGELYAFAG